MAKDGMKRRVFFGSDPTYAAVLGRFNREAREARKKDEAMKPFRVIATVVKIIKIAGYRIIGDLKIQNVKTGEVYISRHLKKEEKPCPICGSENLGFLHFGGGNVSVMCEKCRYVGPMGNGKDDAVNKWNKEE